MRYLKLLNRYLFYTLSAAIAVALIWLSQTYQWQSDWTFNTRNSLSPATTQVLEAMEGSLEIVSFTNDSPLLRSQISDFIARYQALKPDLEFRFVNPDSHPAETRELGISVNGELVIRYRDRVEKLRKLNEQHLTNALQRLLQQQQHWIIGLKGHGERALDGQRNFDLGSFTAELNRKGYRVQTLDAMSSTAIPENTSVLIISGPRVNFLAGEWQQIEYYLERGGNLLWLTDPHEKTFMTPLYERFGIVALPGVVVDASSQAAGVDDPTIPVVTSYPAHEVTRDLTLLSLFPKASALEFTPTLPWKATPLLATGTSSWNETGVIEGAIRPESEYGEQTGPLVLAWALSRQLPNNGTQRVVITGDGDFLANAYLANAGNLDLGLNIIHWLTGEMQQLAITAKTAPDRTLNLSRIQSAIIGFGFLFGIPMLMIIAGITIRWRRNRR